MTIVEEIDELLAPRGTRAGRDLPAGDEPMSYALLIEILLEVFKQRAAAGWPFLKRMLEKLGLQLQTAAETAGDAVFGAAPADLKETIEAFLRAQMEKVGPLLKIGLRLLLAVLPQLIDGIWDNLFARGMVAAGSQTFPVVFTAGPPVTEEEALATINSELTTAELTELCLAA